MTHWILSLSSNETDLAHAGGKGANLASLARAGHRVPPGFVVSTDAYRAFVDSCGMGSRILAIARVSSPEDPVALDKSSAEIRALFESCDLPPDLKSEIISAYHELGHQMGGTGDLPVAVRSSATAEDLPGLAFAGQQETYLNVIGPDQVVDAVRKCWSSLWTSRAMAYRARNGIRSDEIALAVVVQEMIESEVSGVVFTANPLSGRRDEIVIDASYGLGESVVSGQVEPDHYVFDARAWRISERHIGAKALSIVSRQGGGTREIRSDGSGQALSDERIVELARMAHQVAAEFGSPQDLEWAFAQGRLHLLQSRPITSLYPVPRNPFSDPGLRIYFALSSIQGLTDPFTPIGGRILQSFVLGGVTSILKMRANAADYLPLIGERLYIDVTDLARDPRLRSIVTGLMVRGDPGALAIFRRLVREGRIPFKKSLTPRRVLHVLSAARPVIFNAGRAMRNPEQARPWAAAELSKVVLAEQERIRGARDLGALLDLIESGGVRVFASMLRNGVPVIFPSMLGLSIVRDWLEKWLGERPGLELELMRGLSNNVTTEMDLALWHVAERIRSDPDLANVFQGQTPTALAESYRNGTLPGIAQEELSRFLQTYGMRSIAEIDLGRPRWGEDPTAIMNVMLGYLALNDPGQAPDAVFARGRVQAESLAKQLVTRVRRTRFGALRAKMLGGMIFRMRTLGGLRELPKFMVVRVLGAYRTALLERGRELCARGLLERADDIFYVPFDVLKSFAAGKTIDLKAQVASSRAAYDRESARRRVPRLLLSTGEAFYEGVIDESGSGEYMSGDPVSPGVAEGRVRVVIDPRGVRLEPGEILVCPATDPGWTPLFLTAGGLVMEIGGVVTHGSVVAREYGIPAVVGVHEVTTRLQTGQRVRVDGNTGRVTILDPGAA